jgi:hypothetical protein
VPSQQQRSFASWQLHHGQGEFLEQPEDFEDDHDNDDHSNYVKDVSAHAGDSYQIACAMVKIYPKLISHPSKLPNESTQLTTGRYENADHPREKKSPERRIS